MNKKSGTPKDIAGDRSGGQSFGAKREAVVAAKIGKPEGDGCRCIRHVREGDVREVFNLCQLGDAES